MKTTMKKVLSMALALVLVLGMLPMAAQATDHTYHYDNNANNVCDVPNCEVSVSTPCNHPFNSSDATCTAKAVCRICGLEHGELAAHSGGTATCKDLAVCDVCGQGYGSLNAGNHVGGEEVRDYRAPSCVAGYSGDTWCLGCNTKKATGIVTEPLADPDHVWEAATATTPQICSVCRTTGDGPLGTATISVKLLIGGTSQNAGSFSITAGGTKTATEILNTYLANSTYSASTISSSYVVDSSAIRYTDNQSVAITAGGTYTLYVTPVSSVNNNQSGGNNGGSSGPFTVGFVPNYNTYNYATYVANTVPHGFPVYSIAHNITRTGYTLEGWYFDAALTKRVPNDATITGNATFYAKWTQIAPYNVSVVIYTNGNKNTPTVTLDLYGWAQDGVITLADLQQAVAKQGIKANNNAGLSVYGPFTPNQWTSYVSHDYFRNSTERVSVNSGEATVLYAMVHNVKITKGTVDPYGAIADKTNPKTGDMIYAPMMVLGLSASALAVLFYLNKKRAF